MFIVLICFTRLSIILGSTVVYYKYDNINEGIMVCP